MGRRGRRPPHHDQYPSSATCTRPGATSGSRCFMLKSAWMGCSDVAVMMFCPYRTAGDFDDLFASGEHVLG